MKLLFDQNLAPRLVRDLFGPPPKVIWIRRGNCSVEESARILRDNSARLHEFEMDQVAAYLILS